MFWSLTQLTRSTRSTFAEHPHHQRDRSRRKRFGCDASGKRRIYMRPPNLYGNVGLTRKSNRAVGIKWEHKAILVRARPQSVRVRELDEDG